MQLDPVLLSQIMYVLLITLGILALAIILGYAIYGTDTEEE